MRFAWLIILLVLPACLASKESRRVGGAGGLDGTLTDVPASFFHPRPPTQTLCPTVEPGIIPEPHLSPSFLNNCAGCHGTAGEGYGRFPALTSVALTPTTLDVIRHGGATMPAFAPDVIRDETLVDDFNLLAATPKLIPFSSEEVPSEGSRVLDETTFTAVMQEGLRAWRLPGQRGACMSCHGPDGIDLARLDYSNGAMFRRSIGQGLPAGSAQAIVRMIAALRGRYDIRPPCHARTFAPLQPGGSAIEGSSSVAAERTLLAGLSRVGVSLTGPVQNDADARALAEQIRGLDVRKIPIAIKLNRWTEDAFHGEQSRSTAEWIPEIPMEAKDDPNTWIAVQNAYLEDPTDSRLWALLDQVKGLTGARFITSGVSERLAREKYKSVLLLQHQLRRGTFALPDLEATSDKDRFSVWEAGLVATIMARGCSDPGSDDVPYPCWGYPNSFYEKMGRDRSRLLNDVLSMTLPWLVAGWLQDPSLTFTEGGDAQMGHVHEASEEHYERLRVDHAHAAQLPVHNAYMSFVRLTKADCWGRVGSQLSQWIDDTLPSLTRMLKHDESTPEASEQRTLVEQVVTAADQAILLLTRANAAAPTAGCAKTSETPDRYSVETAMAKILAWHRESGMGADAIAKLVPQP